MFETAGGHLPLFPLIATARFPDIMHAEHFPTKGRVADKVALVTGAGSGIGRATATTLAQQGAAVACADLYLAGAEETAAIITASGGTGWVYRLDVTDELAWQGIMDQILSAHG